MSDSRPKPAHDLALYAHPFSSYCQKVLIALYENGTPFELRLLSPDDPQVLAEFAALWPLKRFPVLVDGGRTVIEASIIIEYLGLHHPGSGAAAARRCPRRARSAQHGPLLRQLRLDAAAEDRRATACGRKRSAIRAASPTRARCSTPPTAGSTR